MGLVGSCPHGVIDDDVELRKELKKIDWGKYLEYGIVEIKVRSGECKTIDVKRTYIETD